MSASLSEGLWGHGGMLLERWDTWSAVTAGKRRELALNPYFPVVQSDDTTPKSLTEAALGVHAPSRLRSSQRGLLHISLALRCKHTSKD